MQVFYDHGNWQLSPRCREVALCPDIGEAKRVEPTVSIRLLKSELGHNEVHVLRTWDEQEITHCVGDLCHGTFKNTSL